MATVVEFQKDGKRYIYLGASYSYYKEVTPSFFGGDLFPNEEEGEFDAVLVSDENGKLVWLPSLEVRVVSIDGKSPSDIL